MEASGGLGIGAYQMDVEYDAALLQPETTDNGTPVYEALNTQSNSLTGVINARGLRFLLFDFSLNNIVTGNDFLSFNLIVSNSLAGQEQDLTIDTTGAVFDGYDADGNQAKYTTVARGGVIHVDDLAPRIQLNGGSGTNFTGPVTIHAEDLNLDTIQLNGSSISNDTVVNESGSYTVTVTDKAGHSTTTSFTLEAAPVDVTGVSLDQHNKTMIEGESFQLTATVEPSDATNKAVTWTSSNPDIATVVDGKVTAVAPGDAIITVKTVDGSFTDSCEVHIDKAPVYVTDVTLDHSEETLNVGDTLQLNETVLPENADNKDVTWESSNDAVASVSDDGLVTANGAGDATITVTTVDGGKEATCEIHVVVPVTGISLDKDSAEIKVGEKLTLKATIEPDNATNKEVRWTSSAPEIATVDENGVVTALKGGDVIINATAVDNNSATAQCRIHVAVPVSGVKLDQSEATIDVGDTLELTATVLPNNADNQNVTWSVEDDSVATVSQDGVVTAVNGGTTTVTVTTVDGSFTASCEVTVEVPVTDIELDKNQAEMRVGDTLQLNATVLPENATNKEVRWHSSDSNVATVDENGLVTAVGGGDVIINATAVDNNYATTQCQIHIIVPVSGIELTETEESIYVDEEIQLHANVLPENAENKNIIWSVDDDTIAEVDQNGLVTGKAVGDVTVTAAAADGGFKDTCVIHVEKAPVPVTGVELNETAAAILDGETLQLVANVLPEDATNKEVTWTSDSEGVATVDENGLVTAVAPGKATITVRTAQGGFEASCVVTVNPIAVTGVELDETAATINLGETLTLNATVLPENASNKEVTWSVEDDSIASVNNGVVTGLAGGTTTVTVTTVDGSFTASCKVTVNVPVTGVELNKTSATINAGETLTLNATVLPADASNKEVTWSVEDDSIASVNNGVVTGLAGGTTTVTVTTVDGEYTASCAVTVIVPATGVEVTPDEATLKVGETLTLNANVLPADATNQNVTWSVNDSSVATVDQNGVVTGLKAGDVTVTVTTADGNFTAESILHVENIAVESINLSESEITLASGSSMTLTAEVLPANATIKDVTWSIDDENVATVENGVVTAKNAGDAVVTVTSVDNPSVNAQCIIHVYVPVSEITLSESEATVDVGDSITLTANVLPENATNKDVIWSVNDESIATVNNGVVTALKGGDVVVTATSAENEDISAQCVIHVNVPVTGVTLDSDSVTLTEGNTMTLHANVQPVDASNQDVIWSIDDETVATIENGVLTAVKAGEATVTVTTVDGGFTASMTVTVKEPVDPTDISLDVENTTLNIGDTLQLHAMLTPSIDVKDFISWTSSDENVLTVSEDGLVTAVGAGTATITATTVNGLTATCEITVNKEVTEIPVTGVKLNRSAATIGVDGSVDLEAIITPENATNKNVTWTSSNEKVATVSKDGTVIGVSEGTAVITVTTEDGSFTAECVVTVQQKEIPGTGAAANTGMGGSAPSVVLAYCKRRDQRKGASLIGARKEQDSLPVIGMNCWVF